MEWTTPLLISIKVAFCSSILVFIIGTVIAYFLAQKSFRGKNLLEIMVMMPLVLPPTVTGYYLVVILGRNGFVGRILSEYLGINIIFSWYGAVIAATAVSLPLMVQSAKAAIESVDKNLIQVSYTLGHSELATTMRVILPLARNGIFAGFILAFTRSLGEFGATLMLAGNIPGRTNTMPLEIYSLATAGEWEKAQLLVAVLTLTSAAAMLFAKYFASRRPV
jgi:molybdate transport system permease protein